MAMGERQITLKRYCILLGSCALISAGSLGCDPGNSDSSGGAAIDPEDTGSDEDVGAGDMGSTPVEVHGKLQVVGTKLQDESGAVVQLKGVSSMWLNWEEDGFAEDPTALRWMRNNWHLKVIRASMGVEPDGAYLSSPEGARAQVETIVENAIAAGVYVIIDWHDHNAEKHKDEAVAFFSEMAAKYGDKPNVLYEPFNEPLAIDWKTVLKPYHEAVVAAIRAKDPDNVIILGTPNWSQDVDIAAQAKLEGTNLMYTLHFYACTHTDFLRTKANSAVGGGLALFVTEWGATHADGGTDGKVCLKESRDWHEWMNSQGVGWAAWKLDNCAQDSSCILAPSAPRTGGWTSQYLHGHGTFVRARMQAE
jgi:endoglucanase